MTNVQIKELLTSIKSLTKADVREIMEMFGPCEGSIEIANRLLDARNLIIESQCQECFDGTHKHDFNF